MTTSMLWISRKEVTSIEFARRLIDLMMLRVGEQWSTLLWFHEEQDRCDVNGRVAEVELWYLTLRFDWRHIEIGAWRDLRALRILCHTLRYFPVLGVFSSDRNVCLFRLRSMFLSILLSMYTCSSSSSMMYSPWTRKEDFPRWFCSSIKVTCENTVDWVWWVVRSINNPYSVDNSLQLADSVFG